MTRVHIPVLANEVIDLLELKKGDLVIDATLDGGGHSELIAQEIGDAGKILGIEWDAKMIKTLNLPKNIKVICGNFADIEKIAMTNNFNNVSAILFDLGLSSWHLEKSSRGFSFRGEDEPLFMNFTDNFEETAARILNGGNEEELAEIFRKYGEEPRARTIAKKILEARKEKRILTVGDLKRAIKTDDKKMLARVFQALRIKINGELENLQIGLLGAVSLLKSGGRIAVISYHSLEDRIVKIFTKDKEKNREIEIITKKPITPSKEEISKNSRSRSAKLRVLEKI